MSSSGRTVFITAGLLVIWDAVHAETYNEPIGVTTIAPGYIDTPIDQDMKMRGVPQRSRSVSA
jgi:hypothetical protein